jgi:transposase-like protein
VDTDREVDTVSTMDEGKSDKRPRRSFTDEFKAGAVRLVPDEGKSNTQAARDLDLTVSALRVWVEIRIGYWGFSASSAARSRSSVLATTLGAGARSPRGLKMTCGLRS